MLILMTRKYLIMSVKLLSIKKIEGKERYSGHEERSLVIPNE